jgi:hypothetical protein
VRYGFRYLLRGIVWCLPLIGLGFFGLFRPPRGEAAEERRERRFALAMVLGQSAAILYTGADHFREMRFFVPMLPFLLLLASRGIEAAGAWPGRPARVRPWMGQVVLFGGVAFTLLASFFYGRVGYDSSLLYGPAITRKWAMIGEWLRTTAAPGDLLATPVAGAMPFVSGLPTLDMLGLTDRTIAHKKAALGGRYKDHEKFDTDYMLSRNPDWIFLGHFQVRDLADYLRRPALPVGTDLAKRLPLPGYELVSGQYRGVGLTFLRKSPRNGSR